ncbi:hypothetical protein E4T56_gene6682 [Termitomyces sp. T112]|nr:hypothetical protein E4T56_gene6682 [Termitomyces sp. T112]
MTINKSQGQSVKHVGLDLQSGVFSHGQLYVALLQKHIKKDCKYCLSGNPEWSTNHLMSIAGPCSIDILNGLQIISNIYQWTL